MHYSILSYGSYVLHVVICRKFHEEIVNVFYVIKRTQFCGRQTDRQMDRQTGRSMSPYPKGEAKPVKFFCTNSKKQARMARTSLYSLTRVFAACMHKVWMLMKVQTKNKASSTTQIAENACLKNVFILMQ